MKNTIDTGNGADYELFLRNRSQIGGMSGFEPLWIPDFLFPFQRALCDWSIRKGKAAIFSNCGTGKTPMQLVWAENVVRHTKKPVLILTPLAVAAQTGREAKKFDIEAKVSRDGAVHENITVANYERLHYFHPDSFSGVVCDESSCLKAMNGKRRREVGEFLRTVPYRLLCTATAAPNDYVEIGTSSESLGEMGQKDMITMFFKQVMTKTETDRLGWGRMKYRMKGHAEEAFWRWVCSWARACRMPSDLGFSDDGFILPELTQNEHIVKSKTLPPGFLFEVPAQDMREELAERRRTIQERCEKVSDLVNGTGKQAIIWCHLNPEGDLLAKLIKDGRQVRGSDSIDAKESAYESFINGQLRVLIIKPKIGAYGLNLQCCDHIVTFASHSYESRYQAIRRCWRFGQKNPVTVDTVVTEGEQRISASLERKSQAADRMFTALVASMNESLHLNRGSEFQQKVKVPSWM